MFILAFLSVLSLLMPRDSIELVFAGDAMQHQRQIDAAKRPDGSLSYDGYFTALAPYISSADYAVVNLETPLGGAPYSGYPMFCAHDNYLDAITDAGFDLVLTANNHILDRRDRGVRRTVATLSSRSIPWLGAYRDKVQRDSVLPMIKDINGFRIAFLNYTYGTNGISKTSDIEIDYIDRALMRADILEARDQGAELVCVCVHWGDEYKLLPNSSQRSLADWLLGQGVDLVIGSHPHVIQPMEIRDNPATGRPAIIVYSLGNFISAMRTTDTRGGAMCRVVIDRDILRRPKVRSASYRLVFTEPASGPGTNFRLLPAESPDLAPGMRGRRDAFVSNAVRIFDRHNRNVPRDTTTIAPR